jgi:thioredoxin 1
MRDTGTDKDTLIRAIAVGLIVLIAVGIFIYKNRTSPRESLELNQQLVQDLPTLLELSSTTCPPCREMIPILEQLKKEYDGRVNIKIIDIDQQPDEVQKYSIRVIPTQILLDADGKEIGRHEGFIPKEELIKAIEGKMGVR